MLWKIFHKRSYRKTNESSKIYTTYLVDACEIFEISRISSEVKLEIQIPQNT